MTQNYDYAENVYIPREAEILSVKDLTPDGKEKLFTFRPVGWLLNPGEFVGVMVTAPSGLPVGKAAFSLCSSPNKNDRFQIAVRRIDNGTVTPALHLKKPGDTLGIFGPFGKEFPAHEYHGRNIVVIAGGIGLYPARRPLLEIMEDRAQYDAVRLLFGTNTVNEFYFGDEFTGWRENAVDVRIAVARPPENWTGGTKGFVTALIPSMSDLDQAKTVYYVIGPDVMFTHVLRALDALGVPPKNVFISTEGQMRCFAGFCGHCRKGGALVCTEGPVFQATTDVRRAMKLL